MSTMRVQVLILAAIVVLVLVGMAAAVSRVDTRPRASATIDPCALVVEAGSSAHCR